jgi:hypothetical protein
LFNNIYSNISWLLKQLLISVLVTLTKHDLKDTAV